MPKKQIVPRATQNLREEIHPERFVMDAKASTARVRRGATTRWAGTAPRHT